MKTILCYGASSVWGFMPGSLDIETNLAKRYSKNEVNFYHRDYRLKVYTAATLNQSSNSPLQSHVFFRAPARGSAGRNHRSGFLPFEPLRTHRSFHRDFEEIQGIAVGFPGIDSVRHGNASNPLFLESAHPE